MNLKNKRRIVYEFKWGKSIEEIAHENKIDLLVVEQIVREYMIANSPSVVR